MASVSLSAENDDVKDSDSVVNSESEIASSIQEVKADDTPVENDDPNEPGSVAAKVVSKKVSVIPDTFAAARVLQRASTQESTVRDILTKLVERISKAEVKLEAGITKLQAGLIKEPTQRCDNLSLLVSQVGSLREDVECLRLKQTDRGSYKGYEKGELRGRGKGGGKRGKGRNLCTWEDFGK